MHGFAHMLPHTLQPALAVAVATGAHPPFSASFYHFVLQHPELVLREEHRDVVCGTEGTIVSALLQKHVTTTAAQRRVCASFKPKLRKESTRSNVLILVGRDAWDSVRGASGKSSAFQTAFQACPASPTARSAGMVVSCSDVFSRVLSPTCQ